MIVTAKLSSSLWMPPVIATILKSRGVAWSCVARIAGPHDAAELCRGHGLFAIGDQRGPIIAVDGQAALSGVHIGNHVELNYFAIQVRERQHIAGENHFVIAGPVLSVGLLATF